MENSSEALKRVLVPELYIRWSTNRESMAGMKAVANGWPGAVLNLALLVGMIYSPTERIELILFTVFMLLGVVTVWVLLSRPARGRNLH